MDGTILNTLEDLTDSLNYALEACGHAHDYVAANVKHFFGSGIHVAIERALAAEQEGLRAAQNAAQSAALHAGEETAPRAAGEEGTPDGLSFDEDEVNRIQKIFVPWYAEHCAVKTDAYPGIREAIRQLRAAGVKTAVVSNKPDVAVQKLAKDYFDGLFDLAVGEKEGVRRKPAPDMTDRALLQVPKEKAVYIGDSEVDLETAANAGLSCVACAWGFRGRTFLAERNAPVIIDRAEELVPEILGKSAPSGKPVLWIVIPCYNEEAVLPITAPMFLQRRGQNQ